MYWLEISVVTDGEAAEAVAEVLRPYGYSQGVVLEQLGDASNPDPDALEPIVTVKIYLPQQDDQPSLRRKIEETLYHLNRLYPVPQPNYRKLMEEDWANAWRKNYRPFRVGRRLWIQPSWQKIDVADIGDIVITLDPGMAFGTGLHPTTQMCLRALEENVAPGSRVLDIGTGSGILAIAAAKLGASRVLALDNDYQATKTAYQNAVQNGVKKNLEIFQGTLPAIRATTKWDIVLVNILAPVIVSLTAENDLLGFIPEDGRVILSGIIEDQVGMVQNAIENAGGVTGNKLTVRDWVCIVVEKSKTPKPITG